MTEMLNKLDIWWGKIDPYVDLGIVALVVGVAVLVLIGVLIKARRKG